MNILYRGYLMDFNLLSKGDLGTSCHPNIKSLFCLIIFAMKTPPSPPSKRVRINDGSLASYRMLLWMGLPDVLDSSYFECRYLREAGELLHTTMLFKWLLQEFGTIDRSKITYDDVESVWLDIMEIGDLGRRGVIARYYIGKELDFWNDMYPKKLSIEGTKENPIVVE